MTKKFKLLSIVKYCWWILGGKAWNICFEICSKVTLTHWAAPHIYSLYLAWSQVGFGFVNYISSHYNFRFLISNGFLEKWQHLIKKWKCYLLKLIYKGNQKGLYLGYSWNLIYSGNQGGIVQFDKYVSALLSEQGQWKDGNEKKGKLS